ncbi:hypothetical protein [Agrobacterium pusense]|uniref:hypothetical protein n=1 Tax=Agrobacterium pusense TaxID=648995 RepID=UPI001572D8CA|nr:hypothetical protein [Agrobacterium pusense]NTE48044.1 hypothetical protein [Agrobacterium pusense]
MSARSQAVTDYCTIWPSWRFLTRARETGAATAEDTSRPRTPLATLLLIKNGSIKNDSFRTALGPDAGVPGTNALHVFVSPPSVLLTASRRAKSAVARPITIIMGSLAFVGQLLSGIVSRTG